MKNATPPKSYSLFNVPPGVWLLMLGMVFVGFAFIGLSRRGSKTIETTLQASDTSSTSRPRGTIRFTPSKSELEHQGRRLREWVQDLKTGDSKGKRAAQDAVVAIGSEAIPALAELLSDTQAANAAAFALARIGREALPVLLDALTNGTTLARVEVAGAMSMYGPDTEEAVTALVECLHHDDASVRGNAIASLQAIPRRPDIAVPTLTACLMDADAGVRGSAATVMRKFGHDAEPALSMLVRLAQSDTDSHVRTRAAESLRFIAPERADREGL